MNRYDARYLRINRDSDYSETTLIPALIRRASRGSSMRPVFRWERRLVATPVRLYSNESVYADFIFLAAGFGNWECLMLTRNAVLRSCSFYTLIEIFPGLRARRCLWSSGNQLQCDSFAIERFTFSKVFTRNIQDFHYSILHEARAFALGRRLLLLAWIQQNYSLVYNIMLRVLEVFQNSFVS